MTILFTGWEPGDLSIVEGYGNYNTTVTLFGATTYDSTLARMSFVTLLNTSSYSIDFAPQGEAWFHCAVAFRATPTLFASPLLTFRSAADANAPQLRLMATATGSTLYKMQVSANGGTSWTDVGSTFTIGASACNRLDIHYKFHASAGILQVYVNETQVLNYSGALVGQNNVVDNVFVSNNDTNWEKWWSEFVVTDSNETTIGARIAVLAPSGTGAQTDWAGTYADVDEAITSISDLISSDTVGSLSVFDLSNVHAGYNRYAVNTIITALDCTITADATIADLQAVTRVGTTNYFSANLSVPHDSARHRIKVSQTVNPATGLPWSITEANALQVGVKAV